MNNNETLKYEVFGAPNTVKHKVFDAPKSEILRVSCSRVQHEILELLYKQKRRCNAGVGKEFLIKNLDEKISSKTLKSHVDYLNEKGYVIIKPVYDGFITIEKFTLTKKGMDLVENPEVLNSEFPPLL